MKIIIENTETIKVTTSVSGEIHYIGSYFGLNTIDGERYSFNYNGALDAGSEVSSIDGIAATDNYDLFNKFIAIL